MRWGSPEHCRRSRLLVFPAPPELVGVMGQGADTRIAKEMDRAALFTHYEKVYFHEINRKEQIFSRLNIPLAIVISLAGFYALLLNGDHKTLSTGLRIWFWIAFFVSAATLVTAVGFLIDALVGRMDQAIPTPNDTEEFRRKLVEYYKEDSDAEASIARNIESAYYGYYMHCASLLTINNDRKASSFYYCVVLLITAAAIALAPYAILMHAKM